MKSVYKKLSGRWKRKGTIYSEQLQSNITSHKWNDVRYLMHCNPKKLLPQNTLFFVLLNEAPEDVIWMVLNNADSSFKLVSYLDEESRQYPMHLLASKCSGDVPNDLPFSKDSFSADNEEVNVTPIVYGERYSLNLLSELAILNPHALTWPDTRGHTPLHLSVTRRGGSIFRVIELLCDLAPSVTGMEDNNGSSPMELAICEEDPPASPFVLDLLHKRTSLWNRIREGQSERYRLTKRKASYTGSCASTMDLTNTYSDIIERRSSSNI